jgi:hypothetical protein
MSGWPTLKDLLFGRDALTSSSLHPLSEKDNPVNVNKLRVLTLKLALHMGFKFWLLMVLSTLSDALEGPPQRRRYCGIE